MIYGNVIFPKQTAGTEDQAAQPAQRLPSLFIHSTDTGFFPSPMCRRDIPSSHPPFPACSPWVLFTKIHADPANEHFLLGCLAQAEACMTEFPQFLLHVGMHGPHFAHLAQLGHGAKFCQCACTSGYFQ